MNTGELRSAGRKALRDHWGMAILVTLVAIILGGSMGVSNNLLSSSGSSSTTNAVGSSGSGSSSLGTDSSIDLGAITNLSPEASLMLSAAFSTLALILVVYLIVTFFIGGAITLGLKLFNIRLVANQYQKPFSTLFERFNIVLKALLLQLAMFFFIFLWTLLFVIPGIIATYRYAMAPYLMAQNPDLGVMEAIGQSKQMMMGHKGRLFLLDLSFIGWAFLSVLTAGIGLLWLYPYINASEAAFYMDLTGQEQLSSNDVNSQGIAA